MPKIIEWVNRKFGMLTVIALTPDARKVLCCCECGTESIVYRSNLTMGITKSCGCLFLKFTKAPRKYPVLHKLTYSTWKSIKTRCFNPNEKIYKYYGGRGITICDEWLDYNKFVEDMGVRPSIDMTIDRINADGNYEASNCRWATKIEQARNRRKRIDAVNSKACLVCNSLFLPKKKHNKYCSLRCSSISQTKGWINHGETQ